VEHAVEVVVEAAGLADGGQQLRVARLEAEAQAAVGGVEQLEVDVLHQVDADEQPELLGAEVFAGEALEKLAAPRHLHAEEGVGDVDRPLRQVEEAPQGTKLLQRALDGVRPPRHLALRPLHAKRAVKRAPPRQVQLRLRGHPARDGLVPREEAPVGHREVVKLVDGCAVEHRPAQRGAAGHRRDDGDHAVLGLAHDAHVVG
jgi:hypothetical protein